MTALPPSGAVPGDRYRWMEEDSAERRAWLAAQADHAVGILAGLPGAGADRPHGDGPPPVCGVGVRR